MKAVLNYLITVSVTLLIVAIGLQPDIKRIDALESSVAIQAQIAVFTDVENVRQSTVLRQLSADLYAIGSTVDELIAARTAPADWDAYKQKITLGLRPDGTVVWRPTSTIDRRKFGQFTPPPSQTRFEFAFDRTKK